MTNKEALKEVSKDIRVRKIYDNGGKSIDRYTITFDILNQETKKWELILEKPTKKLSSSL